MVKLNFLHRSLIPVGCILAFFIAWGTSFVKSQIIQVNGRRIYRKGQQLVLNCTTATIQKYSNSHLIWTKGGRPLPSQPVNNDTLQLVIPNVQLTDSGGYRCAVQQQTRVIRSVLVHVTVGVNPPQPINVNWRSVNFRICINWSPAPHTNNDPVTYKVHYRCVTSCELEDVKSDDETDSSNIRWHVGCKNTAPIPGRELHCCLSLVDLFTQYEGVVIATNRFGMSMSKPFNFSREIGIAIPAPPKALRLQAKGYGEIALDWTPDDMSWPTKYVIYYNTETDKTNKTVTTDANGQYFYRLTNLKPFTKYTVYLAAIDPISKTVGIPVGPVSIVTREEEPSDAPEVVTWETRVYSNNKQLRYVTVHWKLPPKETWNGRLTKYIIKYRRIRQFTEHVDIHSSDSWGKTLEINNSSAREGTIDTLRVDSAYEVEMQMCNREGCGGIGNRVVIDVHQKPKYGRMTHIFEDSLVIGCISTVSIVLIVVLVIIITKTKMSPKKPKTEKAFDIPITIENSSAKEEHV